MYHYVYKTTNTVTGKVYIGAHSSNIIHDDYLGSGKTLKNAVKKYGKESFIRTILEFFQTRVDAFKREAELVTEDFIKEDSNYNMCPGGLGSSVKTQEFKNKISRKLKGRIFTEEHRRNKSLAQTGEKNHRYGKSNPNNPIMYGIDNGMFGKKHSEESKKLMSQNRKLAKIEYTPELVTMLSMACKGKLWYNNGVLSNRFKEGEQPEGYVKGRRIRKDLGLS